MNSYSVIVADLDIVGVAIKESKTDPPLIGGFRAVPPVTSSEAATDVASGLQTLRRAPNRSHRGRLTPGGYGPSKRYANRSALNEPSHSSLPTRMAIAVPVNDGVAGPRASSLTAIVLGSIVAAM